MDYDEWHTDHAVDDDITALWHEFVKNSLRQEDFAARIILEIGCGRGGFSGYLAGLQPQPAKIYACDYSESALKIGRARHAAVQKITWQKEDIQQISFPDNFFNTAISCETIEHIPRADLAIKELYRVMKPGGRLFLTCPNYFNLFGLWCLYRLLIGKPYTEGGQPFVKYLLMPRIYFLLRHAGFRIEQYYSAEIIIPARVPKHFYDDRAPGWLKFFGHRTFYVVSK